MPRLKIASRSRLVQSKFLMHICLAKYNLLRFGRGGAIENKGEATGRKFIPKYLLPLIMQVYNAAQKAKVCSK